MKKSLFPILLSIFILIYNIKWLPICLILIILLNKPRKDLLCICSAGGHLSAMLKLEKIIKSKNYILITEKNKLSKSIENYNIKYVIYSTRYYLFHYILVTPINIIINICYFIYYNPKIILTTGSHTGVFMCFLGKIFGRKVIFIEVFDRYKTLSLSAKIVYRIVDIFIVQHQYLKTKYPKAIYIGGMY